MQERAVWHWILTLEGYEQLTGLKWRGRPWLLLLHWIIPGIEISPHDIATVCCFWGQTHGNSSLQWSPRLVLKLCNVHMDIETVLVCRLPETRQENRVRVALPITSLLHCFHLSSTEFNFLATILQPCFLVLLISSCCNQFIVFVVLQCKVRLQIN